MKVFVYGTLKSGGRLFLAEHAKNVRPATVQGKMYTFGNIWFPFADFMKDGIVQGEIHEYDPLMLDTLDRIELGAGYRRVKIVTNEGEEAWAYHYPEVDEKFTEVEDGYFDHLMER